MTHLGGCNHLRFTQRRCVYVINSDIVQTALLLTEISQRSSLLTVSQFSEYTDQPADYILVMPSLCRTESGQPP